MVPGGPALTPAAWRGAGATSCKSALNGHFRLRASPRRVFTRLNCSRIMRGLGEARGKFGSGKKKKKYNNNKTPQSMHHPPELPPCELLAFLCARSQKASGVKGRSLKAREMEKGLAAGRGRRVREIRRCQPPAPGAGMSLCGAAAVCGMEGGSGGLLARRRRGEIRISPLRFAPTPPSRRLQHESVVALVRPGCPVRGAKAAAPQ